MQEPDAVREFLIESSENLTRLDGEVFELERAPRDRRLIGSICRSVHTIQSLCGSLCFAVLGRVTHEAENLLSQVHSGERAVDKDLIGLAWWAIDAIRQCLRAIETTGSDRGVDCGALVERLRAECSGGGPAEGQGACIDVGLLERLTNLVGELAEVRDEVVQLTLRNEKEPVEVGQRLNRITTALESALKAAKLALTSIAQQTSLAALSAAIEAARADEGPGDATAVEDETVMARKPRRD